MKSIIRFFAKEHLLGNLLTVLALGVGIYSTFAIRRDIWPKVDMHATTIRTILGGASPEQVEKLVINPIESALREVDGIKKIRSSATESTAVTVLELDPDARDPDQTNSDIQSAIDRIDDLPEDAEKPVTTIIDSGVIPIIEITVSGDAPDVLIRDSAKLIYDEVSLMREVARVTKQGYRKKEYLVEANSTALAQRNVSLASLISSIKLKNLSIPGGGIVDSQGNETLVRTEGQFTSEKDVENTFVVANSAGFGTKIGDVANVTLTLSEPELLYHANGKKSVNLVVSKKENADALVLVESIKNKVVELQSKLADGIELGVSNDFSVYLSKRLKALTSNLFIGLFLVIIILTLFLPWQVTLVVAVGIPIALFGAIIVVYLAGLSLNLLSLIGLIIVLGMLVDDAIVVSENIWRHIEDGDDVATSVVTGASEVLGPVLASILTTVSAFAPMLFMTGIFGAFVFEIPMMVILALAFSFLEAFIIMPSHFVSWVSPFVSGYKAKKNEHWFDKVVVKYKRFIELTIRRRYRMLAIILVIFATTIGLLVATGRFILFPSEGVEIFFAQVEAPTEVSLQKMDELIAPIEDQIHQLIPKSELLDSVASVGIIQQDIMDPQTRRGSNYANIRVTLTAQSDRERTAQEIIAELREKVETPEGISKLTFEIVQQGPPQGRPVSINIMGENFDTLNEIAKKFKDRLSSLDGVEDVRDSFQIGKKEWQVVPDSQAIASVGLSVSDISQTVRAAFKGIVASSVRELDEEIDIRVKLQNPVGEIQQRLNDIKVGNIQGNLIDLKQVAKFVPQETLSLVQHSSYKRVINVSAGINTEKTTAINVNNQAQPILREILKDYPGYDFESSGEDKDTQESMASLGRAFIFAFFFIFALLVITFKNLYQPLLIITSIPLGFIGVVWAMFIHGRPLSFMAMLGIIALAGVIVNNSIVFIDFVNNNRKKGKALDDSIIDAAGVRLRPIFLTTVTTISGLLPTAYGDHIREIFGFGGGDPFIIPIALALGWGLAIGSLLTGIFFPSFIRILDDFAMLTKRLLRRA